MEIFTNQKWGKCVWAFPVLFFLFILLSFSAKAQLSNDLAVSSIASPLGNSCGDSLTKIKVIIENKGTASQSNFQVTAKVGTQTFTGTYSGTLASTQKDTVILNNNLNTQAGGSFIFVVYTSLSTDQARANDTLKTTLTIGKTPNKPKPTDVSVCGAKSVKLGAVKDAGTILQWFTTSSSTAKPVFSGDTFVTPILTSSTTYYVHSSTGKKDTIASLFNTNNGQQGAMYNVKTFTQVTIDSFDFHMNTTSADTVEVYYKTGTFVGYETTASAWTFLGKSAITGKGTGKPITAKVGALTIPSNSLYGIYVRLTTSTAIRYTDGTSTSKDTVRNSDLELQFGKGISGKFGGTFSPRILNTRLYYTTGGKCASVKVPVTVTIKKVPGGATVIKGSTFNGIFNSGTSSNPDKVCAGNTINYEITPPSGFTNAGFGTTWNITKLSFATAKGTLARDTLLTLPSSSGNGKLRFIPRTSLIDSTIILNVTLVNIATGCDSSFSRYVFVGGKPSVKFGFANSCDGQQVIFRDSSVVSKGTTYYYTFGDGDTSTSPNPLHKYKLAGTYNVKLVLTSTGGCKDSITRTVSVNPMPKPAFSITNICDKNNITFTNNSTIASGSMSYLWYFGDGTTSTSTNPVHSYPGNGIFTAKLIVTSDKGCRDSVSSIFVVFPTPKAKFGIASSACLGRDVTFIDSSTIASGGMSRTWTFGDGNKSTATNPVHQYTSPGIYQVKLVVAAAGGCKDSITKSVTVSPSPVASFSTADACLGTAVNFSNTSSISSGSISGYKWDFGNGNTSTQTSPTQNYTSAGKYNVKLVVTTALGCKDSVTKTVNVLPKPVAGFTAGNVCMGEAVKFTNSTTITPSSTTVNYLWDFGDGKTSLDKEPTHLYTSLGTYTVKLIAETPGFCSDEMTKQITVSPRAAAKISMKGSCQNRAVMFTDSSSVSSGKIASRIWKFGDGTASSSLSNPTYIYKQPGVYTIKLKVTTDNGCSDSTTSTLTVTSTPVAGFTASGVCEGEAVSFTNTSVAPSGKYLWYFGDGDTSSQTNPSHIYKKAGTFKTYLAVANPGGCVDTIRKDVVIKALPSAKFTVKIDSARNIVVTPDEQGHTDYFWKFGDGNTSNKVIAGYKYSKDGNYTINLLVTGSNGCSSERDTTINISTTGLYYSSQNLPSMKVKVAPNPFLSQTQLSYELEKSARVKVSIYDLSGKEITVIADQKQSQGKYIYTLDAESYKMNAGIYLIRVLVDDALITKQIIRLK